MKIWNQRNGNMVEKEAGISIRCRSQQKEKLRPDVTIRMNISLRYVIVLKVNQGNLIRPCSQQKKMFLDRLNLAKMMSIGCQDLVV